MLNAAKLRVVRPTDDLEQAAKFYREGLGLREPCRFEDRDSFDGVMRGLPGAPYHFAFTCAPGHRAGRAPTADNLLVFYLPDASDWQAAVTRFKRAGYEPVPVFNPDWDRIGLDFEDPNGYRVVLQRDAWEL